MRKIILKATIFFQLFTSLAALFLIYIIFALLDMNDFDLISGMGFIVFQPIFGAILSGLTVLVCFLVGLPIRLIPKLHSWWTKRPLIVFISVFIGLIFLCISLNSNFTETTTVIIDNEEKTKNIPNKLLH